MPLELYHAACISRRANTILIAQGAELLGRYDSDASYHKPKGIRSWIAVFFFASWTKCLKAWECDEFPRARTSFERALLSACGRALRPLVRANAASRSKRTGKPCRGAAMPNGRCKVHGGKSTGPRTPEGLERSRRANWKHGHFSREARAERSRLRAAILTLRYLRMLGH
jgi:hypothetical protein